MSRFKKLLEDAHVTGILGTGDPHMFETIVCKVEISKNMIILYMSENPNDIPIWAKLFKNYYKGLITKLAKLGIKRLAKDPEVVLDMKGQILKIFYKNEETVLKTEKPVLTWRSEWLG